MQALGDTVRSQTLRKVEMESSTGSVSSEKKKISLTIRIDAIDFDAQTVSTRQYLSTHHHAAHHDLS
jgi:protein pelota